MAAARATSPCSSVGGQGSLGPQGEPLSRRDRLIREGRLRPGTQDWAALTVSSIAGRVDIQASLRAVRGEPEEERGRHRPVR